MENVSDVPYLTLSGYVELPKYRYVLFIISLILYIFIVCSNTVLISLIYAHKSLHEPMYIFLAALFLNALFGTSAFYPKLLNDFFSDSQVISYPACAVQAFAIYTYGAAEFTLLSVMAYDRYVSICKPLQYATIMKISTVKKFLFFAWIFPACEIGVMLILTNRLTLCKFQLNRLYCDNYSIVKLSCEDTTVNNIYGIFVLIIAVFPALFFIVFSYIKILVICHRSSKETRKKALQTCLPHLLVFINFSINSVFEIVHHRLQSNIPHIIRMVMSVEFLVIPPLFNPVIYGLKLQEISNRLRKLFCFKSQLLKIPNSSL
ncbi:olfactory receptor 51E1-like [Megalops cyprinoides]|uniref:olfactory receptor 51E1-like n=1 Tax=Megalops cyprinoides TaxID=118141 RepID=UPI0018646281|nr:olfactory receptor 51E1-like [Megalops cyprinoides]